ncbi:MAG: zf-HC2 domain-containing protein [Cryobacterium sp.]
MTAQSDPYVDWDAAYVLGALSLNDRRNYERHLDECEACSRAVAELAGIPGLLAAVPVDQVLADEGEPPDGSAVDGSRTSDATLRRLLTASRREQSRARGLLATALVGVAAAAAAVAIVLAGWAGPPGAAPGAEPPSTSPPASTPPARAPSAPPVTTLVMKQVVPSPLSADLRFEAEPWGTKIVTSCTYAQVEGPAVARGYALYVTDREGASSLIATWAAGPGTTVTPVGTTSLAEADIRSVDIRSLSSGRVLLESRLEP